ncbi:MAG: hypothetical protein A2169_08280 [Deltaproteobacteria bacterium RBG_13_47_9]|nr:MAG: hypothetical protein A2169_08280 [Deltaproteobacteria bacterium RBG_13_47_9]
MHFIIERLFQFLLPSQCPCCETFLEERQQGVCQDCLSKIHWIESPLCPICGSPFTSREIESHPCSACLTKKKYFTIARALGYYEGFLREAIHRWKYEGKTYLTPSFGEWLTEGLSRYWDPSIFDLLIPVPLYQQRLRERGFNQALLLVRELSHRTGIPYRNADPSKEKVYHPPSPS